MNLKQAYIETPAGKRPLTDLEKCLLIILGTENNISSSQMLKIAKQYKICATCSDRSEVFSVGARLSQKKLVVKSKLGREYIWRLSRKGKEYLSIINAE